MSKLFLGVHDTPLKNSEAKCLMENWIEERAVEKLDFDRKEPTDFQVNKDRIVGTHRGLISSVCENPLEDLTTHLDGYRPPDAFTKLPSRTKAAALQKIFVEKAKKEFQKEKERQKKELREAEHAAKKANLVIKQKGICPIAKTFRAEFVNEQPVTFWSKHSKTPLGVSRAGDVSFRRNTSFSTPIQLSYNSPPNSVSM